MLQSDTISRFFHWRQPLSLSSACTANEGRGVLQATRRVTDLTQVSDLTQFQTAKLKVVGQLPQDCVVAQLTCMMSNTTHTILVVPNKHYD